MSEFKAKNKYNNLQNQVIYKARYNSQAYPIELPNVQEFNFMEYVFYGAIDVDGSSIYPNFNNFKNFPATQNQNTYRAFDFVVDMHRDVQRNIQAAIVMGEMVSDNDYIKNFEVNRSYESPTDLYQTYLANILIEMNGLIKSERGTLINITHLDSYVKYFQNFLMENYRDKPITFSGWLKSEENSLFSTGLAFSIADLDLDDDDKKVDNFISSNMFPYYQKICLNRGLTVHKQCPWILVADISSPAITPYLNDSIENILDNFFIRSYSSDHTLLKSQLIKYFNNFVLENRFTVNYRVSCNKSIKRVKYRNNVDYYNLPKPWNSDDPWIDLMIDLRNLEEGLPKAKSELRKIKKTWKIYRKHYTNKNIFQYIDDNFKIETFKKPYGFQDRLLKEKLIRKREEKRSGIDRGTIIAGSSY